MTKRDFYKAVANGTITPEIVEKANELIQALDNANSKRASKPSKTQKENEPLYPAILATLNADTPTLSTAVATATGLKTQKVTGLLGNLLKENKVTKVSVPVKGKGKQTGWLLVTE